MRPLKRSLELFQRFDEAGVDYCHYKSNEHLLEGLAGVTDLDILVRPTEENAERVWSALLSFGAPLTDLTKADLSAPNVVFQIGVVPCRVDILTTISGVGFDEAWEGRKVVRIGELDVAVLGRSALLKNKKASGRPKDVADVAWMESGEAGPD